MLLENLKQGIASLELVPSGGGCFEVTVDGEKVWSKLDTGEFPAPKDILRLLSERAS